MNVSFADCGMIDRDPGMSFAGKSFIKKTTTVSEGSDLRNEMLGLPARQLKDGMGASMLDSDCFM